MTELPPAPELTQLLRIQHAARVAHGVKFPELVDVLQCHPSGFQLCVEAVGQFVEHPVELPGRPHTYGSEATKVRKVS